VASVVLNQSGCLQFSVRFRDALAAHSQHVRDQFLVMRELVRGQPRPAQSSQRHSCCSTEWCRLQTAVCAICVISAWVVAQQQVLQRAAVLEFPFEDF